MAPSGNVISFEDAKRISSSKSSGRPSVKASKRSQSAQESRSQVKAASASASKRASKPSVKSTARKSVSSNRPRAAVPQRTASRASDASRTAPRATALQRTAAKRPAWMDEPPVDEERLSEFAMQTRSDESRESRPEDVSSKDRSEQRRRKRAKEKASRQFLRQFGGEEGSSSEPGTRAAVYKAEMGKEHKRAFEQMGGIARSGAAKVGGAISRRATEPGRMGAPRFIVWGGIVACLAAVCVFIYPSAQQYYIELRDHDRLQAEYDAVAARNEAIQGEVDYLSTDEGMEDAARSELGWVYEGEQNVVVSGLPEETEQESTNEKVRKQVVSGSVSAPDTWYSSILDPFFGYDPGTQVKIS